MRLFIGTILVSLIQVTDECVLVYLLCFVDQSVSDFELLTTGLSLVFGVNDLAVFDSSRSCDAVVPLSIHYFRDFTEPVNLGVDALVLV